MPRIRIADLPQLQDLTPEQLKELFGAGPRRFRPTLEAFEERMLPSLTPLSASLLANVQLNTAAYAPAVSAVQPALNIVPTALSGQVQQAAAAIQAVQLSSGPTPLNGAFAAAQGSNAAALAAANLPALTPDSGGSIPINNVPGSSVPGPILPLGVTGLSEDDPGVLAIRTYVGANLNALGPQVAGVDGTIHATSDGIGRSILFTFGTGHVDVLWSRQTGVHMITEPTYLKWLQLGGVNFGYPTNDGSYNSGGSTSYHRQDFLGLQPGVAGAIVSSSLGTYEIHGAIYQEWLELARTGPGPLHRRKRHVRRPHS